MPTVVAQPSKQYTMEEFKQFVEVFKNTPASTTLTAPTLHGPFPGNAAQFGIFSGAGVRPERYSTLVRPNSMAALVNILKSEFTNEILEVMTGQTAAAGTNATGFCGDPPTVGQGKICRQIYTFAKWFVKTDLNSIPEIGQFRNRADVPATILNGGPTGNPLIPELMFRMLENDSRLKYEFWRIGVALEQSLESVLIQGLVSAGANNTHGWISEFDGLDRQIRTGYVDSVTSLACEAMDSAVITHGANVNTTASDGRNIVQELSDLMFGLRQRASGMGMDATTWVIVMRRELFRAFVEQYSCLYNLFRCSGTQYEENNTDQTTTNNLRLEMLNGEYILVDGVRIPVVWSEGITQTTPAANTFESDMYIVPINWAGRPLLNLEHFPMDNANATEFSEFQGEGVITMNNGMYMVGNRNTGLCKEYHFASMMRLILETPWLAGRIDNLQYTFSAPIRNAFPGASYYADGGVSYRQ